jgi:hypothetical protein
MENNERKEREEIFSTAVKAGKRTYFFDVKQTMSGEKFITITESKRKFNDDDGTFSYEKHKIFLYREDNEKFIKALTDSITFIETGVAPEGTDDTSLDNLDFKY